MRCSDFSQVEPSLLEGVGSNALTPRACPGSALIKDLHHYDQKLPALQRADEADDTLKLPARSDSDSSVHRQSRRGNLRRNGKGPVSYCETEDEDQPPVIRLGGRVEKFVAKRKRVVAKVCSVRIVSGLLPPNTGTL